MAVPVHAHNSKAFIIYMFEIEFQKLYLNPEEVDMFVLNVRLNRRKRRSVYTSVWTEQIHAL